MTVSNYRYGISFLSAFDAFSAAAASALADAAWAFAVFSAAAASAQGLTLVHFSAQLEPCPAQENTLHTLNTP